MLLIRAEQSNLSLLRNSQLNNLVPIILKMARKIS